MYHAGVSSRRMLPPGEYDRTAMSPVAKLLWTLLLNDTRTWPAKLFNVEHFSCRQQVGRPSGSVV